MVKLPDVLDRHWALRGYYGTINHNVKATYVKYLGWFDGNPATLHPLPPEDSAKRYLEFMGGADAVLEKARAAYDRGEYRWVAEVVNHVVFAEPQNTAARELQADALEQLGYQSEAGHLAQPVPDRRAGAARRHARPAASDAPRRRTAIKAMSLDLFFNYLGRAPERRQGRRCPDRAELGVHRHRRAGRAAALKRRAQPRDRPQRTTTPTRRSR